MYVYNNYFLSNLSFIKWNSRFFAYFLKYINFRLILLKFLILGRSRLNDHPVTET